ncbi:hypothetical protein ABH922_000871 [Rhodococcus sp. 27YEA15]
MFAALVKIVGAKNLTPRLVSSVLEIGRSLGGLPQLGSTASAGDSSATVAAREILSSRKMKSGSYVHSPKRILGLQNQTSMRESMGIAGRFLREMKP